MLQYKIPQNIGIEDKIVGPFSLRQLIIISVGCGISYVLFAISSKIYELNIIEYIIIALPGVISIAAAMIKINNISFTKFVLLSIEFAIKPKKRMWDRRGIMMSILPDLNKKEKKEIKANNTEKDRSDVNLNDLTKILDSGGFDHIEDTKVEDIDSADDENLITQAYFGHKKDKSQTKNMYWRTAKDREKYGKRLKLLSKIPRIKKTEKVMANVVGTDIRPKIPNVEMRPQNPKADLHPQTPNTITAVKTNKRKRKKKPRNSTPIRHNTQINNTQKQVPVQFIQHTKTPDAGDAGMHPQTDTNLRSQTDKEGEIHLEELQKGIEFNLN